MLICEASDVVCVDHHMKAVGANGVRVDLDAGSVKSGSMVGES